MTKLLAVPGLVLSLLSNSVAATSEKEAASEVTFQMMQHAVILYLAKTCSLPGAPGLAASYAKVRAPVLAQLGKTKKADFLGAEKSIMAGELQTLVGGSPDCTSVDLKEAVATSQEALNSMAARIPQATAAARPAKK